MELARCGARWRPLTSSFVVPRARHREKEASPQGSPAPAPALLACSSCACLCPSLLCLQHVRVAWACLRAGRGLHPAASLSRLLCPDNSEEEPSVCRSHPSRLIFHLHTDSLQTPCTCSQALPAAAAGAAASQPLTRCCCLGREGQAASPTLPGPLFSSLFLYWQMPAEPERGLEGTEVGKRNPAEDLTKTPAYNQLKSSPDPASPSPPDPMHPQPHRCICLNISLMSLELMCNTNVTHFT